MALAVQASCSLNCESAADELTGSYFMPLSTMAVLPGPSACQVAERRLMVSGSSAVGATSMPLGCPPAVKNDVLAACIASPWAAAPPQA